MYSCFSILLVLCSCLVSSLGLAASPVISKVRIDPAVDSDLKKLIQSDLDHLARFKLGAFTEKTPYFDKIFGGYTGTEIIHYFDERIHYILPPSSSIEAFTNLPEVYKRWGEDKELEKRMKDAGAQVGAANTGAVIWIENLVEDRPLSLRAGSALLPIQSTRSGLMKLGPGYISSITAFLVVPFGIPWQMRASALLHEARHSDCPTGLTSEDVALIRKAKSLKDFSLNFKNPQCGNLHAYCPDGHHLKDIPACDRLPWGSYAVGAIFDSQARKNMSEDDEDFLLGRTIVSMSEADNISRVLVDWDDMMAGRLGEPDLSSKGFVDSKGGKVVALDYPQFDSSLIEKVEALADSYLVNKDGSRMALFELYRDTAKTSDWNHLRWLAYALRQMSGKLSSAQEATKPSAADTFYSQALQDLANAKDELASISATTKLQLADVSKWLDSPPAPKPGTRTYFNELSPTDYQKQVEAFYAQRLFHPDLSALQLEGR